MTAHRINPQPASLQVRHGYVSMGTVPANSYVDKTVTFSPAFSGVPAAISNIYSSSTSADLGHFTTTCINISKTQMTVRVFNGSSSARTPGANWIAVF